MKKTFEISAYGVEEMNQQELLMVDGGDQNIGALRSLFAGNPVLLAIVYYSGASSVDEFMEWVRQYNSIQEAKEAAYQNAIRSNPDNRKVVTPFGEWLFRGIYNMFN